MKIYRIQPKEWMSLKYVIDYIDYNKSDAINRYLKKFPQFKKKDLRIS